MPIVRTKTNERRNLAPQVSSTSRWRVRIRLHNESDLDRIGIDEVRMFLSRKTRRPTFQLFLMLFPVCSVTSKRRDGYESISCISSTSVANRISVVACGYQPQWGCQRAIGISAHCSAHRSSEWSAHHDHAPGRFAACAEL